MIPTSLAKSKSFIQGVFSAIESAKAFVERMKEDGEFRRRIAEAESPEVKARILKYEGYDFTEEELDSLRKEVTKSVVS